MGRELLRHRRFWILIAIVIAAAALAYLAIHARHHVPRPWRSVVVIAATWLAGAALIGAAVVIGFLSEPPRDPRARWSPVLRGPIRFVRLDGAAPGRLTVQAARTITIGSAPDSDLV